MTAAPDDWVQILDQLLAGDRLAFLKINRLITGFLAQLRAYDFRDEWEDLRQEVLLAVVANARAGRLRDPHKFLAYARIITRNKFFDRLGRQVRQREHEKQGLPWDEQTAEVASALPVAAEGDNPVTDVWFAARDLPTQQQLVLEGIYRQGKTYQEVSDETGIPLGTVKRRLREALATLRERLGDEGG